MVEAFSIRGLGRLAESWLRDPPFPDDSAYGGALQTYRDRLIERYSRGADGKSIADTAAWFTANRPALDRARGLGERQGLAIIAILGELERDLDCVADMGAVNRWPALSAVAIERYIQLWRSSCAEIGLPGRLPLRLSEVFGLYQ